MRSLDAFFATATEETLADFTEVTTLNTEQTSREIQRTVLRINDISNEACMLEFVILGQTYDVLRLAFLGRMKG